MDIALALSHGWKGSEWTLNGDDYSGLVWLSESPMPLLAEIEAVYPDAQAAAEAEAAAVAAARESAVAKLAALGLSEVEVAALLGGKS